jgi:putative membrane protein
MIKHLLIAAAPLLLLPACGEQASAPDDRIEVTGQAAGAPAGPAPQEVQGEAFASSVLGSLDFSLASARLAVERVEGANTRALAQKMAMDFGAARQALAELARAEPVSAPTHQSDLAILSSTRGEPLEKAFAEQQMEALTLLVGTVRAYKNGGDNAALKDWAEKYQGVINDRLLDVQTLRAELEGEG